MNYSAIEASGESGGGSTTTTRGKNKELGERFSQLLHGIMGAGETGKGAFGSGVDVMDLAPAPVGTELKVPTAAVEQKEAPVSQEGSRVETEVKEEPKDMGRREKQERGELRKEEASVLPAAEAAAQPVAVMPEATGRELIGEPVADMQVETALPVKAEGAAESVEMPDEQGNAGQSAGKQAVTSHNTGRQQAKEQMQVPQEFEKQVLEQETATREHAPKPVVRQQPTAQGEPRADRGGEEALEPELTALTEQPSATLVTEQARAKGGSAEEGLKLQLGALLNNGRGADGGTLQGGGRSTGSAVLNALAGAQDKTAGEKAAAGEKKRAVMLPRAHQQQVIDKVKSMLENAAASKTGTTMTLKLNPVELGAVTVRVTEKSGRVFARITPDSAEVENLLRTKVGEITQTLTNAGLKADDIHISIGQERSESEMYRFNEFFGNHDPRQGEHRSGTSGRGEQGGARAGISSEAAIPVQPTAEDAGWVA